MPTSDLLAKLSLWKHEKSGLLAMLVTLGQVAIGGADLDVVTDTDVTLRLARVVKHVPLSRDESICEVSFSPADVLAVWLSTTFEQPQHIDLVTLFDERLQIVLKAPLPEVTIWRATQQQFQ